MPLGRIRAPRQIAPQMRFYYSETSEYLIGSNGSEIERRPIEVPLAFRSEYLASHVTGLGKASGVHRNPDNGRRADLGHESASVDPCTGVQCSFLIFSSAASFVGSGSLPSSRSDS